MDPRVISGNHDDVCCLWASQALREIFMKTGPFKTFYFSAHVILIILIESEMCPCTCPQFYSSAVMFTDKGLEISCAALNILHQRGGGGYDKIKSTAIERNNEQKSFVVSCQTHCGQLSIFQISLPAKWLICIVFKLLFDYWEKIIPV